MKAYKWILFLIISFLISCSEEEWSKNYDINFPIPFIESIDKTNVNVGDIITLKGDFEKLNNVTIGDGFANIISISDDNSNVQIEVTGFCKSGDMILENLYKKKYTYPTRIIINNSGSSTIPEEINILDFTTGDFMPIWEKSLWTEAKDFESNGYDINKDIEKPAGYEHFYSYNDKDLNPLEQPNGQNGNIPYGNITWDNSGQGFNISQFTDPYVSILINTGDDIAYMSLIINGEIKDLEPTHSPGNVFANGETKHYMKTDNKWIWYTFSLSKILSNNIPDKIENVGLFLRNSWDYGVDQYPGFQLNIAKMIIDDGPRPLKQIIFDFEEEPNTTTNVTAWANDQLSETGRNLGEFENIPEGKFYFSMKNHHNEENAKNYKFAIKNDNNGMGWDFSKMKDPYITFAVNTGNYSGFIDFVFYQASSGNKEAEPWADPGCNNSAVDNYPELNNMDGKTGFYYDTKNKWEWRTYNLVKLLNGVESWGLQNGKYPDFKSVFDYILIWPRDGWNNENTSSRFEINIDYVIVTDGYPTGLPILN